ncbi:MAG: phospholipase D family protein [Bryobacterales bacterium]|nr:phospholipase D family protein [Bryobacterales bacterium]
MSAAKRSGVRVRAIVGISGNATHPDALDKLYEIADKKLMIVPKDDPLFHPKLYLFDGGGAITRRAWVGSANFTKGGFGDHPTANEEMMLEVGDDQADALATWFEEQWARFKERWDRCPMNTREVIEKYRKDWKPPHRDVRDLVSGPVTSRVELLLEDRPSTFDQYHQVLKACDEMLQDENREWQVLNPRRQSYLAAISGRQDLLFGESSWSDLKDQSRQQLNGGHSQKWWGLVGEMNRGRIWPAVCEHETDIRKILRKVRDARDGAFPDIAVTAMKDLIKIDQVGPGTATLLLTLARPDRLLSVNEASKAALAKLLGSNNPPELQKPEGYGSLLRWLYDQRWYSDGPPADRDLLPIWCFRAALVDAFVYDPSRP